ncbi:MAG: hypothetical protein K8U57_37980 [Planctomycetes bacterium]|nr:hypothetical protein [Planctomycetota bacterium]
MAVFPIPHHHWQILRAVKRSRKPPTGRELRLSPTRNTKDGTFLNGLVQAGLLTRVTGTDKEPFVATYSLTELGQHAAEYGECDFPSTPTPPTPPTKRAK